MCFEEFYKKKPIKGFDKSITMKWGENLDDAAVVDFTDVNCKEISEAFEGHGISEVCNRFIILDDKNEILMECRELNSRMIILSGDFAEDKVIDFCEKTHCQYRRSDSDNFIVV